MNLKIIPMDKNNKTTVTLCDVGKYVVTNDKIIYKNTRDGHTYSHKQPNGGCWIEEVKK